MTHRRGVLGRGRQVRSEFIFSCAFTRSCFQCHVKPLCVGCVGAVRPVHPRQYRADTVGCFPAEGPRSTSSMTKHGTHCSIGELIAIVIDSPCTGLIGSRVIGRSVALVLVAMSTEKGRSRGCLHTQCFMANPDPETRFGPCSPYELGSLAVSIPLPAYWWAGGRPNIAGQCTLPLPRRPPRDPYSTGQMPMPSPGELKRSKAPPRQPHPCNRRIRRVVVVLHDHHPLTPSGGR
ncbi:hypothetical protein GQ53DRAFT_73509 [Thozetella sp. PMI_491]|nr:hypothetical protein GQ53DRAFT_73509 [Thozetella sp. PMI_491]